MGFESGSLGVRWFYLPHGLPGDWVERFAAQALPPITTLGKESLSGWVTGRHLLDRNITEEAATYAGYVRLTLVKAERKIPEALLRAECRMEEMAVLAAEGAGFLKQSRRSEIRKEIVERLLPKMPPTLTGIASIIDRNERLVYATALSEKQVDIFRIAFQKATGLNLVPITPAAAALKRGQIRVAEIPPTSFSPELEDVLAGENVGHDFLTWLWFFSEQEGGVLELDGDEWAVMLEGPLTFFLEGEGAHVIVLKRGSPLLSSEAKTALLSGKKLASAAVTLARGDQLWSTTLDAEEFIFRGLKLPKGEQMDAVSRFEDRMLALGAFRQAFLGFYDRFLEARANPARWKPVREAMQAWVSNRPTRH